MWYDIQYMLTASRLMPRHFVVQRFITDVTARILVMKMNGLQIKLDILKVD